MNLLLLFPVSESIQITIFLVIVVFLVVQQYYSLSFYFKSKKEGTDVNRLNQDIERLKNIISELNKDNNTLYQELYDLKIKDKKVARAKKELKRVDDAFFKDVFDKWCNKFGDVNTENITNKDDIIRLIEKRNLEYSKYIFGLSYIQKGVRLSYYLMRRNK